RDQPRRGGYLAGRWRRWCDERAADHLGGVVVGLLGILLGCRGVENDDLGAAQPNHVPTDERGPPGERDTIDGCAVAAVQIDHRQRRRAGNQPQVLPRHLRVGDVLAIALPTDDQRTVQHHLSGWATPLADLDQWRASHCPALPCGFIAASRRLVALLGSTILTHAASPRPRLPCPAYRDCCDSFSSCDEPTIQAWGGGTGLRSRVGGVLRPGQHRTPDRRGHDVAAVE